jgi:hypothetical protein
MQAASARRNWSRLRRLTQKTPSLSTAAAEPVLDMETHWQWETKYEIEAIGLKVNRGRLL